MNEGPWLKSVFLLPNHNSVFSPVESPLPVQRFSLYKTNEYPILNAEIQDMGRVVFSLLKASFGTKTILRFERAVTIDDALVCNGIPASK